MLLKKSTSIATSFFFYYKEFLLSDQGTLRFHSLKIVLAHLLFGSVVAFLRHGLAQELFICWLKSWVMGWLKSLVHWWSQELGQELAQQFETPVWEITLPREVTIKSCVGNSWCLAWTLEYEIDGRNALQFWSLKRFLVVKVFQLSWRFKTGNVFGAAFGILRSEKKNRKK